MARAIRPSDRNNNNRLFTHLTKEKSEAAISRKAFDIQIRLILYNLLQRSETFISDHNLLRRLFPNVGNYFESYKCPANTALASVHWRTSAFSNVYKLAENDVFPNIGKRRSKRRCVNPALGLCIGSQVRDIGSLRPFSLTLLYCLFQVSL